MTPTVTSSHLPIMLLLLLVPIFAPMDKIAELTPGLYKIVKRDEKHHAHLLRVEGNGEKRMIYLDHSQAGSHPSRMSHSEWEEYEVIKKYDYPPEVFSGKLTLTFQDSDRHEFSFTVNSAWALRSVFETMPWLQDPFAFKRNRSRIVQDQEKGTPMYLPKHIKSKRNPGSDWGKSVHPDDEKK
jgi:hypothetical protein